MSGRTWKKTSSVTVEDIWCWVEHADLDYLGLIEDIHVVFIGMTFDDIITA